MQENTNPLIPNGSEENSQTVPVQPPIITNGQKVIQPTPALVQELQAQQQAHTVHPTVVGSDTTQQAQSTPPQSINPEPTPPTNGQMQVGMSASQMGWSQSQGKGSDFNIKKLPIKGLVGLVVLGGVFAVLLYTNIIALSKFKTIDYINLNGTHYNLTFYTKHTTTTLKSGNTSLVSKVSKGGKYPLMLTISSGPISELDKNGIKECSGPFPKVFEVHNNSLNQQISVCSFPPTNGATLGVYVLGFASNNQSNIVTISQDLSGMDLSSQSGAQQSLNKFGLEPYQDDITKIIASIKVQ